jgi:predicted amidohydrolase
LVQFARGREDKRKNIERMLSILEGITDVEIVCLPEAWIGPFKIDEKEGSGILSTLCDVAAENNYLSFPTFYHYSKKKGWPLNIGFCGL